MTTGAPGPAAGRGILVLDMSYTLRMFRERQLGQALSSRTLEGYFDRVLSVHPLAGLFEPHETRFGPPVVTRIDEGHVFVEGRIGATRRLAWLPPLNFLAAQIALVRLVLRMARAQRISVVRVGDPYYLGILGWILSRRLGLPLAARVPIRYDEVRRLTGRATMPRLFRYGWIEKRIERFVFARCDLIAGANEDNMRYALENGGRPEVATVFRYGNLLHASHWVEPAQRPDADPDLAALGLAGKCFVMTVSRLQREKQVGDALHVVAALAGRGCDVHGLIVGEGAMAAELETESVRLGIRERIVFAGNRPQEWLARVLPRAAAIVSPHMGRALVEAALAGVPLVAYDYDWQRELAIDGVTGFLVPNGDCHAMAAMTERLLRDPAEAARLGRGARATAARMMDPGALMQHEQGTYTALLERWAARRAAMAPDRGAARLCA